MIGSIAVFPIVNEIVRSDDSINKTLMTSSSDNVKFDLSTLTGNSLNETFTSQPSNNTLLRAFFNQYKDQIGGTYYNQVFITNDTVNKEFSITAYD
jgi:hypothetical protein